MGFKENRCSHKNEKQKNFEIDNRRILQDLDPVLWNIRYREVKVWSV